PPQTGLNRHVKRTWGGPAHEAPAAARRRPAPSGDPDMFGHAATARGAWPAALATLLALAAGAGAAERKAPAPRTHASTLPPGRPPDRGALAGLTAKPLARPARAGRVRPPPRAGDAESPRRLFLDVTGHSPPAAQVTAFLDSKDPAKRARLIDELLASPDYGK